MEVIELGGHAGDTGGRRSRWCCIADFRGSCSACLSCLCGFQLSWKDIMRLLPCVLGVVVGVMSSVLHTTVALGNNRFPETIPIFWGCLSALPAFMCAVLVVMYHRDALNEKGFTKDAAINLGLLCGFLTVTGILIYFTFVVASLYFIFRCTPQLSHGPSTLDQCKTGSFGYNSLCFLMIIIWLVIQSYLTPRPRFIQELISKHERAQAGSRLAAVSRPHPSQPRAGVEDGEGVTEPAAAALSQDNSVHPTLYGNPVMFETATVFTGQPTSLTGHFTYATTVSPTGRAPESAQK